MTGASSVVVSDVNDTIGRRNEEIKEETKLD
jgi:hypothetical protein